MTTDDNTGAPKVTLGDAVRTTVMAYQKQVDQLDDRDQAYAIDLCRRFFDFMKSWGAEDLDELEQQDREAVIVLRKLYADVRADYDDRPDRTALSLALAKIVEAGQRYGVDVRFDAGDNAEALYPEDCIVRDVATQLVTEHVQRMITFGMLPEHAAAMLITHAGDMGRVDLVTELVDTDSETRKRMVAALAAALPNAKHDSLAILRAGTGN